MSVRSSVCFFRLSLSVHLSVSSINRSSVSSCVLSISVIFVDMLRFNFRHLNEPEQMLDVSVVLVS